MNLKSEFFHPETVRHRLETHQYKESDNVQHMRKLDNLYLVEFQECKLKNINNYKKAMDILFATKVRDYASKYALCILGAWPTQFYLRQIVYEKLFKSCNVNYPSPESHLFMNQSLGNHSYNISGNRNLT